MRTNVLQYLEESAAAFPHRWALADEHTSVTYQYYMDCARKIGSFLAQGIAKGKMGAPIAVMIDRNVLSIVSFLGCVYSGNFYVPVDASMPEARVQLIFRTLQPIGILDARDTEECYPNAIKVPDILQSAVIDEPCLQGIRGQMLDTDPLYAIFTSGSTGMPKGVVVSHRSVIDLVESFGGVFGFDDSLVFGNQAPFDFDVSVKDIYNALRLGATVEVIPKKLFLTPLRLVEYLSRRQINTLIWAVSALRIVADFQTFAKIPAPKLSYVMFSGEVMPVKTLRYWMEHVPQARFVNLYGPTEITCNCTWYEIKTLPPEDGKLPIGRAFPNARVYLTDADGKVITERGCIGEIRVEGSCLALGYWNDTQKTQESFVLSTRTGAYPMIAYRTGDLAYYDDAGMLVFASRKDDQIKHMGHRIELGEIEAALNALPTLDIACCVYDEKREKICCFYQGSADRKREIAQALAKKLPKYMLPNQYMYKEMLPLNKNGKIDRQALKKELTTDSCSTKERG